MTYEINRRRLIGVGGGLAAASTLAACGSSTPGESAGKGGGDAAGKTVIKFWHRTFTPVENEWYTDVVKKFNESQDKIKVEDEEIPADAWDQRVTSAQAAGQMPDVYTHSASISEAVNNGQLHELNEIVGEDKLKEILDSALPVAAIGDKYYAYPLLLEPQAVLFWNKKMFKAAGLDPETPPKTWDELLEFCEKIKPTLSQGQYCIAPAQDAATFAWSTVGQQYNFSGHTALTDDWTKADVENDEYVALIGYYKQLWDKGYMPKQALAAYVEGKEFGEEKVAFKVSGSWMMSEIGSDYPDLLEHTGVAPFVQAPNAKGDSATTLGNFKWVVDAKTKNKEAAGEFLSWCLAGDPELLVPFFVKTQFTKAPVRQSVMDAVAKQPEAKDAAWSTVVTEEIAPTAIPEPQYPWDVSLAVGTAMEAGMVGQKSPEDALKEATKGIQTVIDREKLPEKAPKNN